jgi:phage terminase large subunit GpA-like protein
VEGLSRIGKEYANSDQRKCFLTCPHCQHDQILTWTNVRFDKDENGTPLPKTAQFFCAECGALWSERERIAAIDALLTAPGFGWRQTKEFTCCDEVQVPEHWDNEGRSLCHVCGERSAFDGRAGFNASKLYSKRHRLSDVVQQWMDARGDAEQMRVFRNEAMAEQWQLKTAQFSTNKLLARAEVYGPQDLPKDVKLICAGVDTHPNRLEVQIIGFGYDEEMWVIAYIIIPGDPVQMHVWQELDRIRAMTFWLRGDDRILRINAMGIDMGGHNTAQVLGYCNQRRGSDVGVVFATRGQAGPIPIWPQRSSLSKTRRRELFYNIGVDSAKELIYARLAMELPEPGFRKPGFIHFPLGAENIDNEYMNQLAAERPIKAKRSGQEIRTWEKIRERNEALDTMVIALAVRRRWGKLIGSNPHSEAVPPLPQSIQPAAPATASAPVASVPAPSTAPEHTLANSVIPESTKRPTTTPGDYYKQQAERELANAEKVAAEHRATWLDPHGKKE